VIAGGCYADDSDQGKQLDSRCLDMYIQEIHFSPAQVGEITVPCLICVHFIETIPKIRVYTAYCKNSLTV